MIVIKDTVVSIDVPGLGHELSVLVCQDFTVMVIAGLCSVFFLLIIEETIYFVGNLRLYIFVIGCHLQRCAAYRAKSPVVIYFKSAFSATHAFTS